jgi:hypothetical protein
MKIYEVTLNLKPQTFRVLAGNWKEARLKSMLRINKRKPANLVDKSQTWIKKV